jgi:ABC-2 type transport system permease protein
VRNGKLDGAVIIPPQFSRRVYEENHPQIALVVDNSDNFMSSALESELTDLTAALNQPTVEPRILQQTALEVVELYPYIEYMKYLLPGSLDAGDVCLGDDRRRHAVHRRQGAWRA